MRGFKMPSDQWRVQTVAAGDNVHDGVPGFLVSDLQDSSLVGLAMEGSASALEELARRFWPVAYRTVSPILRCHADAEEVAQEVICSAIRCLCGFRGESSFHTWFHRIAVNQAVMSLRRRASGDRLLAAIRFEETCQAASAQRTPEQIALQAERWRLIETGLDRLPSSYATVLRLYVLDGKSVEEIASQLCLSAGGVKTRLKRGRELLRKEVVRLRRLQLERTAEPGTPAVHRELAPRLSFAA